MYSTSAVVIMPANDRHFTSNKADRYILMEWS